MSAALDKDHEKEARQRRTSGDGEKSKSQINAEYFQALEKWVNETRSMRYSCDMFAGMLNSAMYNQFYKNQRPRATQTNDTSRRQNNQQPFMNLFSQPRATQTQQQAYVDYTIPPLWKRFVAEVLDFMLLFVMKLAVTFIAVDVFDFVNFNKYENILPEGVDYTVIVELTSEFIFLEVLHRLIVCVYETLFLYKGTRNSVGGATPGKSFMGLRVVYCTTIEERDRPNLVRVSPATNIGLTYSLARACLKNLVVALLIPISFPFFFNKYNRSSYDILCHTLVVEDPGSDVRVVYIR